MSDRRRKCVVKMCQCKQSMKGDDNYVFVDFQDSCDEVESLKKRQDDFANTLQAQDDRLKAFSDQADKLIKDKHPDSKL